MGKSKALRSWISKYAAWARSGSEGAIVTAGSNPGDRHACVSRLVSSPVSVIQA